MVNEKKKRQLEAARNFRDALHDLRCEGVRTVLYQDDLVEKITLLDRETGKQIGEFATSELFSIMTGQIIDEFAISTDYFGDLVDEEEK